MFRPVTRFSQMVALWWSIPEEKTVPGRRLQEKPDFWILKKKEGELEVSFFGPFYSAYRIVDLDENGQTAIVCGSDMDLLWILARTPEISI